MISQYFIERPIFANVIALMPGVGQIAVRGAGPYSMRVWLNPEKLRYFSLTTQDVINAIQSQNLQVVAGQLGDPPVLDNQAFQFTVNAMGRLADVGQFESIVIKSTREESAQIVRIRDVARVDLSRQSYSNFFRIHRPQGDRDAGVYFARRQRA